MAWNPATIAGLDNELAFGFEALYTRYTLDSTFPGAGSGSTTAENGAMPVPSIAWVQQLSDPRAKLGLGLFGVAGYTANFPVDLTNPALTPPAGQGGVGFGRVQADAVFFQMPLVLSWNITNHLAVAAGPTLTIAKLPLDENVFASPNGLGIYPRGNGTRYAFGGGAQLGFFYVPNCRCSFGANIKTPSWIESFRYFSETAAGLPRFDEVNVDLPAVVTVGGAFRPKQDVVLTADVRFVDYNNTEGLGDPAEFLPNFAVNGLGWRSVFSINLGARKRLTERIHGMVGYMYSDDPVRDEAAFFNVGADLGYQHGFAVGTSYAVTSCTSFSLAYNYFREWGSTGPFVFPGLGAIPGSSVSNRIDAHSLTIGVNVSH